MKKTFFLLFSLSLLILLTNCSNNHLPEKGSKSYIASIKTWHKKRIENLKKETLEEIKKVKDLDVLRNIEVEVLGRKGKLTEILKGLKDLSLEKKKEKL